jgi:hypothetical protein
MKKGYTLFASLVVALMAVYDQQLVGTYTTRLCIGIKVLQPGKTKLVQRPAIRTDFNDPVSR